MTKAEKSTQLFKQAVEMKRQGNFAEAIRLQKESIRAYPDDPELPNNYYSMGKTFYLMGDYHSSMQAYLVYCGMCIMLNPPILEDFKKVLAGDNFAAERLTTSFSNVARHMGHAAMDGKEANSKYNEIQFYRQSLINKTPDNHFASDAKSYDDQCRDGGFHAIESLVKRFLDNYDNERNMILLCAQTLLEASPDSDDTQHIDSSVKDSSADNKSEYITTQTKIANTVSDVPPSHVHTDNDIPKSQTLRKKIIIAGLMLAIAAGAFAYQQLSTSNSKNTDTQSITNTAVSDNKKIDETITKPSKSSNETLKKEPDKSKGNNSNQNTNDKEKQTKIADSKNKAQAQGQSSPMQKSGKTAVASSSPTATSAKVNSAMPPTPGDWFKYLEAYGDMYYVNLDSIKNYEGRAGVYEVWTDRKLERAEPANSMLLHEQYHYVIDVRQGSYAQLKKNAYNDEGKIVDYRSENWDSNWYPITKKDDVEALATTLVNSGFQ